VVVWFAIIQISNKTFLAYLALRVSVGGKLAPGPKNHGGRPPTRKLPRLIDVEVTLWP